MPILPESYNQFSGSEKIVRTGLQNNNNSKSAGFSSKSLHQKVPFYYPNVELQPPFRIQKVENKYKKYNQEIRSQSQNAMYSLSAAGPKKAKIFAKIIYVRYF